MKVFVNFENRTSYRNGLNKNDLHVTPIHSKLEFICKNQYYCDAFDLIFIYFTLEFIQKPTTQSFRIITQNACIHAKKKSTTQRNCVITQNAPIHAKQYSVGAKVNATVMFLIWFFDFAFRVEKLYHTTISYNHETQHIHDIQYDCVTVIRMFDDVDFLLLHLRLKMLTFWKYKKW